MPFIGPAIAAIGSVLGAAGSFLGGLGTFGRLAIGIGLNVASSLLQRSLQKKQATNATATGVQLERQFGGTLPRQVAMGLVGLAGHDCYANSYSPANAVLQQLFVVSDYPIDGLSRVAINGAWATLDTANPDPVLGYPVTSGVPLGQMWIKVIDGRQSGADIALTGNANPPDRWTAAHVGLGVASILATMIFEHDKLNAMPELFFEIRGARLYDWRKDSTRGGSGAHRKDDPSTHEFSENPIVMDYNYHAGLAVNGDLFCGMGVSAGDLPLAKWTAAANICDEITDGEPRYRCSIMVDCTATHGDTVEAMMLSCGGMMIDAIDGVWPLVGSDQPVVATITDDDLVSDAPVKFRARRSMSDLVNSVSGSFADPEQLWAVVGYETQTSSAALAADRRTRDVSIDVPMVRSARQAGQLAAIYLEENRWEATASITLRPRWQVLEAGDWIRWDSARYGDRTYRVTEQALASLESDGPRNAQLSLAEVDGAIYDGIDNPVIVLPYPPGQPEYLAEVENMQLAAVTVEETNGGQRPAILVGWSAIADVTVIGVDIEYWPSGQPEAVMPLRVGDDQNSVVLAAGVVSNTEYAVRTRLVTSPGRVVAWTDPRTIVTLDARTADVLVRLNALEQEVRNYLQDAHRTHDALFADYRVLAANVASANAEDIADRTMLQRSVGNARARIVEESRLRVSADEAFAERLTLVDARIDDAQGDIAAQATAFGTLSGQVAIQGGQIASNANAINAANAQIGSISGTLSGQALSISQLSSMVTSQGGQISSLSSALLAATATANQGTASGLFEVRSVSAPSGVSVRFAMQGKATAGESFRFAGAWLDIAPTFARWLFAADQFVLASPEGAPAGSPFEIFGGVAYLKTAFIRNLTSDNIAVGSIKGDRLEFASVSADALILGGVKYEHLELGTLTQAASATCGPFGTTLVSTSWATVMTLSPGQAAGGIIFGSFGVDALGGSGGVAEAEWRVVRMPDGAVIAQGGSGWSTTTLRSSRWDTMDKYIIPPNASNAYQYLFQGRQITVTGTGLAVAQGSAALIWFRR